MFAQIREVEEVWWEEYEQYVSNEGLQTESLRYAGELFWFLRLTKPAVLFFPSFESSHPELSSDDLMRSYIDHTLHSEVVERMLREQNFRWCDAEAADATYKGHWRVSLMRIRDGIETKQSKLANSFLLINWDHANVRRNLQHVKYAVGAAEQETKTNVMEASALSVEEVETCCTERMWADVLDYPVALAEDMEEEESQWLEIGYVMVDADGKETLLLSYGAKDEEEDLKLVKQHFRRYKEMANSEFELSLIAK